MTTLGVLKDTRDFDDLPPELKEICESANRTAYKAVRDILLLTILISAYLIFQYFMLNELAVVALYLSIIQGFVHMFRIGLIIKSPRSDRLAKAFRLLKLVGDPLVLYDNKIMVATRDDVHALYEWNDDAILLFVFKTSSRTSESKIQVPSLRQRHFNMRIGGRTIARNEGWFAIPDKHGQFIEGEGIVYCVRTTSPVSVEPESRYSPEHMDIIVDHLKQELNQPSVE